MAKRSQKATRILSHLEGETGTIRKEAPVVIALGYPAPYSVAASSLGAQTVYRTLNLTPGLSCTRFFLPAPGEPMPRTLVSAEISRPVSDANAIAFSVSCETEILAVVSLLEAAGLKPLATDRLETEPSIIIGGPITFLDPRLVAPLADIVAVGEAEEAIAQLGQSLISTRNKNELIDDLKHKKKGIWIPKHHPIPPPMHLTPLDFLPAQAATWSPSAELKNLFLVEATRGCKRGCEFCILSCRSEGASKFRSIPINKILNSIPKNAPGVGLVGAAVTDHPEIEDLVGSIVDTGKRVSLSSIRADRLTEKLAYNLRNGGLRTLTIAADGCSDRLRRSVHKGITEEHLLEAVSIAKSVGVKGMKVYTMLGLPGETEEDVSIFCKLAKKMAQSIRVSVAAQAFVPKPGTPLSETTMVDESIIRNRLAFMRKNTKGKIRILPTSPRWSWVDWKLAHAGEQAATIAIEAYQAGGTYSAWKNAIAKHDR